MATALGKESETQRRKLNPCQRLELEELKSRYEICVVRVDDFMISLAPGLTA